MNWLFMENKTNISCLVCTFFPYEIDCNLSKCNVDINHVPVINVVASDLVPKNSEGD